MMASPSSVEVSPEGVRTPNGWVPAAQVFGFHEAYDPWTGAAWLWVRGPELQVRIEPGYGPLRSALRATFADRPFTADWDDGAFPSMPAGIPERWVRIVTTAGGLVAMVVLASLQPVAGLPMAVVVGWAIAGTHGRVVVSRMGLHAGPAWTTGVGWHEVSAAHAVVLGRHARVTFFGPRGVREATLPSVLLPAARAKLRRLGGITLSDAVDGLDRRYARWAPVLTGLACASVWVGGAWAALQASPWTAWGQALVVSLGLGLMAAAAEARASGWATGAILGITALYAVLLAAINVYA